MISLKNLVAAIALGTALIAAPAVASAKVVPTKHASVTHKKLHTGVKKHTKLHAKKVKGVTAKHVRGTKLSSHKVAGHKTAAGWKHHRSI
jgi:hypothetical protein